MLHEVLPSYSTTGMLKAHYKIIKVQISRQQWAIEKRERKQWTTYITTTEEKSCKTHNLVVLRLNLHWRAHVVVWKLQAVGVLSKVT